MILAGTIANTAAVIGGGLVGLLVKKKIPKTFQESLMKTLGIAVIFLGIAGAMTGLLKYNENGTWETTGTMLMILSLAFGTVIGELLRIEDRMETLGEKMKTLFKMQGDQGFVEGFVTNALVICVGAMAVVGSLQEGLSADASMLYAKALLDGVISMVFAASLGVGVLFAALPLFVYQGAITLLASLISGYLTEGVISNLSYIGSVLIAVVGVNLLFGKTVKVGNMLPALIVCIILGIWL